MCARTPSRHSMTIFMKGWRRRQAFRPFFPQRFQTAWRSRAEAEKMRIISSSRTLTAGTWRFSSRKGRLSLEIRRGIWNPLEILWWRFPADFLFILSGNRRENSRFAFWKSGWNKEGFHIPQGRWFPEWNNWYSSAALWLYLYGWK